MLIVDYFVIIESNCSEGGSSMYEIDMLYIKTLIASL